MFTIVLKNAPDGPFLKARQAKHVVSSVFELLRFWCSHDRYAFLLSSVFIQVRFCQRIRLAPFLRVDECERKAKNGAKHIRFHGKTE